MIKQGYIYLWKREIYTPVRWIGRHFNLVDSSIKLIEEEGEGLLALQRCSREQVTVAQAELNLENIGGFSQCRNIIFWIALLVEWAMKTLLKTNYLPQYKSDSPLLSQWRASTASCSHLGSQRRKQRSSASWSPCQSSWNFPQPSLRCEKGYPEILYLLN